MATDLVLVDQLPLGWIDDNEEDRFRLEIGDLVNLLSRQLGNRWRFNQLSKKIELDGKPIPVFELENLYCHLSQRGFTISKEKAIDAAKAAAMAHSFHPVVEYLDRVASDENIVPAELDQLGSLFWDTQDPLYDAMIRKTVIGAVKRAYEPGCMFRTCLVFKGGQDIGKSTSIRVLASPAWLTDTAQDKHEDFLLAIHGCWIYELAELDSITSKKEAGALKNDLSSPKDDIRVPYGRAHDTFARQSIFAGTSNRDDFLRDETGASRFWVVELPHNADDGFVIDLDRLRANRDAIWKSAVLAYRDGEEPRLSQEHQAESNRRNLGFELKHPWEDYLADWLHNLLPHIKEFTAEEALNMSGALGSAYDMGWGHPYPALPYKDSVEVGKILRRLGCTQDKHPRRRTILGQSKRRRWWHPPDTSGTGQ
ncbi:VapE domain-containing protein [Synechococcus sp. RS9907]|uniref:VapE domain-containing protein n=1 Tax=Synechococcus sp. RS9907 TaxID=221350 RepID=UPI00165E4901|nr:VapE domain-containing protein [Synechococcus sp. RS9907]